MSILEGVEGVREERDKLVQLDLGLGVHVDARGDHHLNELVVVSLCWADFLAETRTETVEGNVLSVTVVLAALGHSFRLTNLRTIEIHSMSKRYWEVCIDYVGKESLTFMGNAC